MAEGEDRPFGGIVLVDDSVPICESLESQGKLLSVLIHFVKSGGIVHELELVRSDGGGSRSEDSESKSLHT